MISGEEVNAWSVQEFLSNAGVMIDGGITRAAIILLGKPVSVFKLRPAVVRVTWSLRDEKQDVVDYEHFTAPFILTVDQILAKVRNLTMREMPGGTLFPDVMQQYDDYSMREILHNHFLCKHLHNMAYVNNYIMSTSATFLQNVV